MMDPSLYDICTRAVVTSLLAAVKADPLRALTNLQVRRRFVKDVRDEVRRHGYPSDVEVALKAGAASVTVVIARSGVVGAYSATFDGQGLADLLNLGQCKPDLPPIY